MFKAARWRSEKHRTKAVFKLQFKATQVPQTGWENMMVTLVPIDVGKPSQRSEKSAVIDGECQWLNAIYESVKLNQDAKTEKIRDNVYQFLVSATGSGKSGVLGEIKINLADYAEVFNKPTLVSLPLQDSNSGAILHVTIERLQSNVEGRGTAENVVVSEEAVDSRDATTKQRRRTLKIQLSQSDYEEGSGVANGANDINYGKEGSLINIDEPVKFHSTRNMPLHTYSKVNLRKSSSFDGISASGSERSSGQYTPKQNASLLSPLSSGDTPRNTDWSMSSAPNGSAEGATNSSGETGLGDKTLEKQKSDLSSLARQLEVSELELQTLRKQIMKESKRGHNLSKEFRELKEERDAIKRKCEELKAPKKREAEDEDISPMLQFGAKDPQSMLEEMKEELDHEKNLNVNLKLQLQKTQDSNAELIFAVRDLEELLEQKCSQEMDIQKKLSHLRNLEVKKKSYEVTSDQEEEQCELNALVKYRDQISLANSQERKILDLNNELELYRKDREDLEMQMEQIALDYEILKQENHYISSRLEQTQLREQLRMQYECSAHLAMINELEVQVESLEQELEKQAESYEVNLASVIQSKEALEQRAIKAEEVLRNTRWNSANTAEQLQKEFRMLSSQMSSSFTTNEELVMKALAESRELQLEKCRLKEMLEKSNEELSSLQHNHQVKCQQLLNLIDFKTKEVDGLLLELKDKSEKLDYQKKSEEARQKDSREEMLILKAELEELSEGQIEQKEMLVAEIERLKTSTKELEMLLHERNLERNKLGEELAMLKEALNKSSEELNALRHLKDERDATIKSLKSKIQSLTTQFTDLKHCKSDDELEKENLRKQVFLLRGDLRKDADIISSIEKRLKDNNAKLTVSDATTKTNFTNKSKRSFQPVHDSQVIARLSENPKSLDVNHLNRHNGGDTHEVQQDISNEFGQLDVTDLQDDNNIRKNFKDDKTYGVKIKGDLLQEKMIGDKEFMNYSHDSNRERTSNLGANGSKEQENLVPCTVDQPKKAEVLCKMEELKERNERMEAELKEMQERYSEMSLKFAEVEGERQQLVITIRTLKNALKN